MSPKNNFSCVRSVGAGALWIALWSYTNVADSILFGELLKLCTGKALSVTRTSGNQWTEKMEVKCSTVAVEVAVEMTLASIHFE